MRDRRLPAPNSESRDDCFLRDIIFAGLPPRGRDWALMAVAGVLASAIKGYNYAFNDQAAELPSVIYFMDRSLYPGDLLFESLATKQPFFWQGLAWAAEYVPLAALVLALHLLVSALSVIGVWALAVNLFRSRESANLAFLLVMLSVPMAYWLGIYPIRVIWPELVQRSFVFPFLLFAFVFALHRRLLLAMVLVGLSVNVHPMTAGYVGLMIFCGALIDRPARRRLPLGVLTACVCAAPMLVGVALTPGGAAMSAGESEQWLALLRLRASRHLFPSTWTAGRWLGALLVLAIGLRAYLAVDLRELRHRTAMAWFIAPLVLWIPGWLFTEVWPHPLLILLQFFRGTKFAAMLGLLYFGHHQALRMRSQRRRQVIVAGTALAVTPALWVVGLPLAALLAVPHFVISGPRLAQNGHGGWPRRAAIAGLLLVMAGGGALAVRQRADADWTNWWGGVPPALRDVATWVKQNTASDTFVIVPPGEKSFRFYSERPIVGTLKDSGPHLNDPENMVEYWRRMQDLGCRAAGPHSITCRDFREFSADELTRLGQRYDADLLVTYRDHDLPWTPIYANERYAVYPLAAEPREITDEREGGAQATAN